MLGPLPLWTWYQLTPGALQSLWKDSHASVTALRKFLRKGIETVLVSGHFLHQTEEALGPAKPAPTLLSMGRLPARGPQAAQSCSVPADGMQHFPLQFQELQGSLIERALGGRQMRGPRDTSISLICFPWK